MGEERLPPARRVLVVCAHPDDESFGLGAIIAAYVDSGTDVDVVCFTPGEASTLGAVKEDLARMRVQEMQCATAALGVNNVTLFDYPDGHLADVALTRLVADIDSAADDADLCLVFDEYGITGHPDHRQATEAALRWARDQRVPVLAWVIPNRVAHDLNTTFGTTLWGRAADEIDINLTVDRTRQRRAIACHDSQASDNPVLWRRLQLEGNQEHVRRTYQPPALVSSRPTGQHR
jgi:LmbE family N-acetylglucosaminyl deacetylase